MVGGVVVVGKMRLHTTNHSFFFKCQLDDCAVASFLLVVSTGKKVMAWLSLDSTTLCVIFLIITLSTLWGFVAMRKEGIRQPDFKVLLDASQKLTAGQPISRKGSKSKGKKKQVCCFGVY